jgi:hypothetical protein
MKYRIFTYSGDALPIAHKLQQEGCEVIVGLVHDKAAIHSITMCLLKIWRAPVQCSFCWILCPNNLWPGALSCRRHKKRKREAGRMGGDSNPRCLSGTHAFQACTINHSVTHPSAAHPNCKSAVREADSFPALISCSRRPVGDVTVVSTISAPRFPQGSGYRSKLRERRYAFTAARAGTIRRAAIGCQCKIRQSRRTRR